jgi:nitroreductase
MGFDVSEADRLLTTTRSVRRRLDRHRAVSPGLIRDALRVATQAPTSGGNQDWRWLVVTDPQIRAEIGAVYRRASEAIARPATGAPSAHDRSAQVFTDHLGEVPVLVLACYLRRGWQSRSPHRALVDASVYGSIFPAVWSLQLALRARGLVSCFLAAHLRYADEVADLVGLPADIGQAGMVAVGWPDRDDFRPARRRPVDEVVRFDRWT